MAERFHGVKRSKWHEWHELIGRFIDAYDRRTNAIEKGSGGNSQQVLEAVNNLTSLVKEKFMGLREDFETLQGKFDSMETAVTVVADDIAALKSEIAEANERANIDLSPLMARADNIEAGLRAAAGSQAGSDPTAPPVEPPVEG